MGHRPWRSLAARVAPTSCTTGSQPSRIATRQQSVIAIPANVVKMAVLKPETTPRVLDACVANAPKAA